MSAAVICPRCEKPNTDNWPLTIDGQIANGGCQLCWEAECDAKWWKMIKAIYGSST